MVDPVEPGKVVAALAKRGLTLKCVLTTHHHWDHAGGNSELVNSVGYPFEVYGGSSRTQALTKTVTNGYQLKIGDAVTVKCLSTPCHTQDHICYQATEQGKTEADGCVFTGDTLFLAGCGRFFEGTAQEM